MPLTKKIITLSLYNRVDYTIHVLRHLNACKGIENYVVIPVIDHDDHFGQNQEEMLNILNKFAKAGPIKIDMPRFHEGKVGCNANIFTCLNIGFKVADFVIHIEDDIILSADALQYFEWANIAYKDDKSVFTVDAYNNKHYDEPPESNIVLRSNSFKPWGWATWIDRWEEIKERWQFSYAPRYEGGRIVFQGGGWDVCMKQYLRKDRFRIYPKLPRCLNIGAIGGCHTPSPEWHNAKHNVKFWAGNVKFEPTNTFIEGN